MMLLRARWRWRFLSRYQDETLRTKREARRKLELVACMK